MRLGCAGCLGSVAGLVLVVVLVGAIGFGTVRMLETPAIAADRGTPEDGIRAQRKLGATLGLGRGGRRAEPIVLSEPEVNSLLAHHLMPDTAAPLSDVAVRLVGEDRAEIAGRLPLGTLLAGSPLSALVDRLPAAWLGRPVWIVVRTRARVEHGSRPSLRLVVERFRLGRQPLPTLALRVLLDPGTIGLLRWPLPAAIADLRVEPGRVVIRPASGR